MKTTFKIRNKTNRQSGCTLLINPLRSSIGWDCVRQYECDEGTRLGTLEFVISYDIATLARQFDLTSKRARELSDLFDSIL
jgi:hypothetical protein